MAPSSARSPTPVSRGRCTPAICTSDRGMADPDGQPVGDAEPNGTPQAPAEEERPAPADEADPIALSESEEHRLLRRTGDIYNTRIGNVYAGSVSIGSQDDASPPDSEVIDD